jgi:hypothetical protein
MGTKLKNILYENMRRFGTKNLNEQGSLEAEFVSDFSEAVTMWESLSDSQKAIFRKMENMQINQDGVSYYDTAFPGDEITNLLDKGFEAEPLNLSKGQKTLIEMFFDVFDALRNNKINKNNIKNYVWGGYPPREK